MDAGTIRNTVLFRSMSEEEAACALHALSGVEREFRKGRFIFNAGNTTEHMGLVLAGSVTVETNDLWGNRMILSHVGVGEFFAETYALLEDEPLLVDVRANSDCRILFLRIGELHRMDGADKLWIKKLITNLLTISAHKNLALSGRSFHTAPKSARGRIMAYLNSVSLQRRSKEFDIPFDRQQLADYLNLDRSALSKELGKMRHEGLIEFHKNHFRVIQAISVDGRPQA